MKKLLRFSLLALFAVLGMGNAMAADTFTFTQGIFSNGLTVTIDDVEWTLDPTWKSESAFNYDANKGVQIGTAKKPATSFTISTTGISKKIQSVVVNCSGANGITGTVNVSVGGTAFGSEYTLTSTATDAQFTGSSAVSGTVEVTYAQTSEKGMYLKSITLYYEDDAVKSPANISWSKPTASVTYGNADDTYKYLPTFQNPNNLTGITFSSDNSDAVSISTDGEIEVEGVGEATLTASFAGNDQYEAAEVTCKVTVNEAVSEKTDISNTEETAYTVAKAVELIDDPNSDLTKEVYVKGKISQIDKYNDDKTITYWISDDGTTTNQFECYHGKALEGADFAAATDLKKGATVIVKGKMKKYNTTYEFDSGNVLVSYDESTAVEEANIENTAETAYTVAKAKDLIEAGEGLATEVYVKGIITKVESYNSKYKSLTYWISDDGTETSQQFEIYSGLAKEGEEFSSKDDLAVGGKVVVKGLLKKFIKGEDTIYEMDKNNRLISYEAPATGISALTIDTDANAPMYNLKGERVDANYRGVVIQNGTKRIQK